MNLNIVFISALQYPNGGAQSIRQLGLARGLAELGHSVHFILLFEQNENNFKKDGIKFNNIFNNSTNKISRKIKKKWHFLKITKTKSMLNKINKSSKIDAVIFDFFDPKILGPLISFCKKVKIPIFQERGEYPFVVKENYKDADKDLDYYMNHIIYQFDGIYTVSNALTRYFSKKTKGNVPTKKILMTVEPDRFDNENSVSPFEFDYLAYCGTMYGDKDGVPILIKAFGHINEEFPELKLVLVGDKENENEMEKLYQIISSLGLNDKIIFTGRVKKDQMPQILNNSKMLCLARPNNKQAEGGFPTKLCEYLATKRPIVVTNVGDITEYVKDNIHAFIADPDSEISFAEKMKYVLKNYDFAEQVGLQGYELTQGLFNYKVQAEELARFLVNRN